MPSVPVRVRPATPADHAAPLLYLSAAGYYDRFAGSMRDAERVLAALWPSPGHTASWEVCLVAERDERPVGVLASFPVAGVDSRVRRFLALAVPRVRPWHWPGMVAHLRAAGRVSPVPPPAAWYVDALAVAPDARRSGVATALIDAAAERAAERGARALALDTGLENTGAQRFYLAAGFQERARTRTPSERISRALGGTGFVSYVRTL